MKGHAISDKLWQHECGCIEAARPYRRYPCREHRKTAEEPNLVVFWVAFIAMFVAFTCGVAWGWVIWG